MYLSTKVYATRFRAILGLGGLGDAYVLATVSTYRCARESGLVGTARVHGEVVMTDLKIAITVGGTRPGRHARAVAGRGLRHAAGRPGVRYDIVGTCGE